MHAPIDQLGPQTRCFEELHSSSSDRPVSNDEAVLNVLGALDFCVLLTNVCLAGNLTSATNLIEFPTRRKRPTGQPGDTHCGRNRDLGGDYFDHVAIVSDGGGSEIPLSVASEPLTSLTVVAFQADLARRMERLRYGTHLGAKQSVQCFGSTVVCVRRVCCQFGSLSRMSSKGYNFRCGG